MKWLNFFLFFILCSGVYAMGLSPSKLDFGEVETGKKYDGSFLIINEESEKIELEVDSSSELIEVDESIVIDRDSIEELGVELDVPGSASNGEYEDIIVFRKKGGDGEFSFGKGVGLKVRYSIVGESKSNQITGYAVKDGEGSNSLWWFGGGLGILGVLFGYGYWRKRRLKHTYY